MKLRFPFALAGLLALALAGCGSPSNASGPDSNGMTTLKVGTIGLSSDAALKIGIDKGFFKAEKLTIEDSTIANPPAGIAAAQSGQLDLAYSPSIPLLNALSQHVPLKVVAAADGYAPADQQPPNLAEVDDTGLFVAKGSPITSPKDLVGKTIAVPARKAQLEVTISKVIKDAGGDPSTVKWTVLDFSSALQSLNSGRVDAAGLVSPFTGKAQSAGDVRLSSPGVAFFKEGAVGLYVSGASTTTKETAALQAFARGINKANAYCNAHLAECQQVGANLTKVPLSDIQSGAHTFWPTSVSITDIQRVNTQLAQLGYLGAPVNLDGVLFK
ncbi:ABC transporter substrate-binding protein [Arthrobacter sp. STN4]|uniref:ABC transporter substrate-binding protein n=1 Tax=Arthrobacter sp. STN4 TaxID=2923276 RepID=UPI002119E3C6|nr:ABC transporter substrate-binding protein [Arthrobacter sp. STN4]MCQ9162827.1 ABC transporter substrate-binding protein [Arthrobacter sp. STN4]